MTTVLSQLYRCTDDYLYTGYREEINLLEDAIDASQTTIAFSYALGGIRQGSRLSVSLEDMLVMSVNDTAKTAEVLRGQGGSTPASATSGFPVYVNFPFSSFQILNAFNAELDSLSGEGLYQVKATNITYNAAVMGYDLGDATAMSVIDVRADTSGPESDWPSVPFRVERKMPTAGTHSFSSGIMVMPLGGEPGRSFRVFYRAPFTAALSAITDDIETVSGIHSQAVDLLPLGAAIRLLSGRAVRRASMSHQGDTRRGEEVTTNDVLASSRGLLADRERRLNAEKRRLDEMWPVRLRTA